MLDISLKELVEYIKNRESQEKVMLDEMRNCKAFSQEEIDRQLTRWASYYDILDYIKEV